LEALKLQQQSDGHWFCWRKVLLPTWLCIQIMGNSRISSTVSSECHIEQ